MKIYDCFTFFNELDLLEIRLNILNEYVHKFILVEARYSHQYKEKPLYYELNKNTRFDKFKDKIHHVIIDDFPDKSYWGPENYQRNVIIDEIDKMCSDEDIVCVSDLDELWDPIKMMEELSKLDNNTLFRAKSKVSYFYFNMIATECGDWLSPMFATAKLFKKICKDGNYKLSNNSGGIRSIHSSGPYIVKNSENYNGWHFSYSTDPVKKVQNFCHSECSWMCEDYFNECIKTKTNPFTKQQTMEIIDKAELKTFLPNYVYENMDKYKHLIL